MRSAVAIPAQPGKCWWNEQMRRSTERCRKRFHKPETTFGNVNADVLADKDPHFIRGNFCSLIRGSAWLG